MPSVINLCTLLFTTLVCASPLTPRVEKAQPSRRSVKNHESQREVLNITGVIPLRARHVPGRKPRLLRRNEVDTLALASGNQEYLAEVTLGTWVTGRQTFYLIVDTGSADTWVAGANFDCKYLLKSCNLPDNRYYTQSTWRSLGAALDPGKYGDGSWVKGDMGYEQVGFQGDDGDGFLATIGVATQGKYDFGGVANGILGLGGRGLTSITYPSQKAKHYDPVFVKMYQAQRSAPNFTLALNDNGGWLGFGQVPDVSHNARWITTPMLPESGSWGKNQVYSFYNFKVDTLVISDKTTDNHNEAIGKSMVIDTGASGHLLPTSIAKKLNAAWDPQPNFRGLLPCDVKKFKKIPKLGIRVNDYTFWHRPETMITKDANGNCGSAIVGADPEDLGSYGGLLGVPFLKNVLAVFDLKNQRLRMSSTHLNRQ